MTISVYTTFTVLASVTMQRSQEDIPTGHKNWTPALNLAETQSENQNIHCVGVSDRELSHDSMESFRYIPHKCTNTISYNNCWVLFGIEKLLKPRYLRFAAE